MTVVTAPAILLLWVAGAASSQVVVPRSAIPSAPGLTAPALSASVLSAPSADAPKLAPSLLSGTQVLGVPGPGVTPQQIEAVKALAEKTGKPWIIHGSRQTGVSVHTGLPYKPDADLDTGLVGAPDSILTVERDMWDGRVPRMAHAPMITVPTIEEAVGRGHIVVKPAQHRAPGALGVLQKKALPLRTERQLSKLAETPRAKGESFKFAVIGDSEPGRFWFSRKLFNQPGVFWRLLARANTTAPDFIFQMGDMVSRGTIAQYWSFIKGWFLAGVKVPYLTALGNHDRHKPHGVTNANVYKATFGSPNYVFERAGWRFVVLDSSENRVTKPQLEWLSSVLDESVPTVVFTHIPPAPLGEFTDWGALKGAGGFKEGAAEFMALMAKKKVKRVYMGHIHALGSVERDGVRYVLTGGGGSPLYPEPSTTRKRKLHHWLSVEAGPNGIVETVHPADGKPFAL